MLFSFVSFFFRFVSFPLLSSHVVSSHHHSALWPVLLVSTGSRTDDWSALELAVRLLAFVAPTCALLLLVLTLACIYRTCVLQRQATRRHRHLLRAHCYGCIVLLDTLRLRTRIIDIRYGCCFVLCCVCCVVLCFGALVHSKT